LIEDLKEGEKIFVYKSSLEMTHSQIDALSAGIKRFGNGQLLCVFAASPEQAAGTLYRYSQNTLVGYVDHFSTADVGWKCPFATWLRVCRGAIQLQHGDVQYRTGH
jgi:hypothetical protein